jgi:hypothetical protein
VQEALSRELEAISSKLYVFLSRRASGKIGPSVILNELQDTNCGQHDNVWQEVIGQGPFFIRLVLLSSKRWRSFCWGDNFTEIEQLSTSNLIADRFELTA